MKGIIVTLLLFISVLSSSAADDIGSIQKDLDEALRRLSNQRDAIAKEQPEIGQDFHATRADLIEKRRKVRIARMAKSDRDDYLKELEKKKYIYQQDHEYTLGQLRDYGLKFEIFLLPSERDSYRNSLKGIRVQGEVPAAMLQSRLAVLEDGITHLENLMGGYVVAGEAVAPDGELKQGQFAVAGPLAWFVADDDNL